MPADNPMSAAKVDLVEFLRSLTDEELLHDLRWSNPWTAAGDPGRICTGG